VKFKVFGAVGRTFAFLFQNTLSVLQIIWLPALLQTAAFFALMPGFLSVSTGLSADPPADGGEMWARMAPVLAPMVAFTAIAIALSIILSAGIARLVVKGDKPSLPFLLTWGTDEWLILGSWALIAAFIAAVAIAFSLFRWVSSLILSSGVLANLISILGVIAILLAGLWICIRLSLFTPATIAERKIGIQVSWEKTEDLFWSLFGFWLIWIVMALIIQFATARLVTPPAYFEAMAQVDFRSPETMREAMRNANAALAAGYDLSGSGNIIRMLISMLLNIVASVVFAVASAVAWKALSDTPAEA
jgi:hypothetical protein